MKPKVTTLPTIPCRVAQLTELSAWLLEARHAAALHRGSNAFDALATALRLAEPHELLRPFVDAGEPIRQLLIANAGRSGRSEGFVVRILELNAPSGKPMNPLTNAELSLLQDLPSLQTIGEIAQARHVAANPVKTHLHGIYAKLGADTRRGAVREARLRGLL